MKRLPIVGILILLLTLLVATTRAMASPMALTVSGAGYPHNTGTPEAHPGGGNTPGAHATEQAGKHGLHGKPTILRGTIASVDASSLVLTLADGSTVTIALTADTKIHVPGPQSAGDTLVTGMHAVVMALTDPNTNGLVARMVVAIPGKPVRGHRVGTVAAYSA